MNENNSTSRPILSIVIPIFNNANCLNELASRLRTTLASVQIGEYEVIFVDDGSRDGSREVLRRLCELDKRTKMIGLTRNFGHQFAITAGFDRSRGEAVMVMDGDLQDPPEIIPEFVEKWRKGFDVVYGVRLEREGESCFKRWTAALFYRILRRLTRTEIALDSGDFRLLSRRAMDTFNQLRERSRFVRGMVSWLGFPQTPVFYKRAPRWAGASQYSLQRLIKLAVDGIVAFSDTPIRVTSWTGFIGMGLCILYLLYIVVLKIFWGVPVQGWASLVAVIVFIGSVQLAVLGMIGQYVGRIFEEVKERPLYIVQEWIGFENTVGPPQ